MKKLRTLLIAFVTLATSVLAFAADPTGTWKFTAEGAQGRSIESVLTLKWDNHQLTGNIENRAGKADITAATFVNDEVTFTVERKVRRRTVTMRYTGKVEADTIKGTIEASGRKKTREIPWTAQRVK